MFIPHTDVEKEEMLRIIGANSIDELFAAVPAKHRFPKLNLPAGLTEMEAMAELKDFASANETVADLISFLGAGAYNHYIPAVVDAIIQRGEFLTAYTPYQPEVSQGTLQAIFEFQSLIANLTGMEVSNASHYDGATATAEAGVMAYHHFRGKRGKILISPSLHPHYRETLRTYMHGYANVTICGDETEKDLFAAPETLIDALDNNTALVIVQYPDFFGRIFNLTPLAQKVHEVGALLAVACNPTALGLLTPPGAFGADIVVGDGQPLGIPLSFGGPYLGFFATKKEYVRKLAGRIVGETVDAQGRRGYVLTLTAREQHIRREKATSNICTNQGLMALAATVYLSLLGKVGFKQVANLCYQRAHYAANTISQIPGFSLAYDTPFFHEFVIKCPRAAAEINEHLLEHDILGGYDLGQLDKRLDQYMLLAVTEMTSKAEIDILAEVLSEISHA